MIQPSLLQLLFKISQEYLTKKNALFFLILLSFSNIIGQTNYLTYHLNYFTGSSKVKITILLDSVNTNTALLMIPRSGPGTYELTNYMAFINNVRGYTKSNKTLEGKPGRGSFFFFKEANEVLKKVSYEVDVKKMEQDLLGGFASSKLRENYLGIIGYSIFGFIDGLEEKPIVLEINCDKDWPIFSTLKPSTTRKLGNAAYTVENYALLADAQYLLGKDVQLFEVKKSQIPLFVAVYSETQIDIEEIGRRGKKALNGLSEYFGYVPMPYYTLCYEFLTPLSDKHDYGFSMEHLNSMTASLDTSQAIAAYNNSNAKISGIIHHMGHSWIPLRSYGTGYKPFEWQTAPLIETIWLNEGFIWYVTMYHILKNESSVNFFKNIVDTAPNYIQEKSLKELSLLGSSQYSIDFNIGRNLYARGALLAHEIDLRVLEKTHGEKSFNDVLLGLLKWTEVNKRAFKYHEINAILEDNIGVDISDIWDKWQKPTKNQKN